MPSNYLRVSLHDKRKKLLILAVFTWFLVLDKIQDGDHWWRHRPPAAPPPINISHLVENIKGFPLKAKSFRNIATFQKLKGGGSINPNSWEFFVYAIFWFFKICLENWEMHKY